MDYLTAGPMNSEDPKTIGLTSPNEIKKEISKLHGEKSLGSGLITSRILKNVCKKDIVMLTYIFNAVFRPNYWPKPLKTAEIILIPKPGKNSRDVSSYRSIISLLSLKF